MTRLLNTSDVMHLVSMAGAVDAMEQAFAEFGHGSVLMPPRHVLEILPGKGFSGFMQLPP